MVYRRDHRTLRIRVEIDKMGFKYNLFRCLYLKIVIHLVSIELFRGGYIMEAANLKIF